MSVEITKLAVNQMRRKRLLDAEPEVAVQDMGTGVMARRGASPKSTPAVGPVNPALTLRDTVRKSFSTHKEQQPTESE
tara:strand:- start:1168 stop:1401 length:234 start_codon:yes stop_codon:yes gene_type:complete